MSVLKLLSFEIDSRHVPAHCDSVTKGNYFNNWASCCLCSKHELLYLAYNPVIKKVVCNSGWYGGKQEEMSFGKDSGADGL